MKQNVEAIQQMTDEIETVFDSSPEIEARFNPALKGLVDEWDKLQINLLENSVLDSTDLSDAKNSTIDDESMQLNEGKRDDQEIERETEVNNSDEMFIDENASDSSVYGKYDDSKKLNKEVNDEIDEDTVMQHVEKDSVIEEIVTKISVDESEASYDFSVLDAGEDRAQQKESEKQSEDENVTELITGKDDSKSDDFDDHFFATCIEDRHYIDEFSQKVLALETMIEKEKENGQKKSAQRIQRNLKLICTPRSEKIKEPEDLSASVCSMISESSGIYSFDHDDNPHFGVELIPYTIRVTSNSMHNGTEVSVASGTESSVAMEQSAPMKTDQVVSIATNATNQAGASRSSRPVEIITRQQAISDDNPPQEEVKSNYDESKQELMENKENKRQVSSANEFDIRLKTDEKLKDDECKKKFTSWKEDVDDGIMLRKRQGSETGSKERSSDEVASNAEVAPSSDENGSAVVHRETEENKEEVTERELLETLPLQQMICYELPDDVMQPGLIIDDNHKSKDTPEKPSQSEPSGQNISAEVDRNENGNQEDLLPDDLVSGESDKLDFIELLRKLESASKSSSENGEQMDYSQQNGHLSALDGPSINIIPPTPRKGSISSCISEQLSTPEAQDASFDLPDINIIPATPRRMSFNSSSPPQSPKQTKAAGDITTETNYPVIISDRTSKPSYKRFASVTGPAPDINVIPPTPRRQSLDLTQPIDVSLPDLSFPMIQVIPPTPRRQSLGSESEFPIIIPQENEPIESENLKDEPSSPSLFSSLPSPIIPRVWNWLEKSVFNDASVDDVTLEDGALIEKEWKNKASSVEKILNKEVGKDKEIGYEKEAENEDELMDENAKRSEYEKMEPLMQEFKISHVSSEWPNMDVLESGVTSGMESIKGTNEEGQKVVDVGNPFGEVLNSEIKTSFKSECTDEYDVTQQQNDQNSTNSVDQKRVLKGVSMAMNNDVDEKERGRMIDGGKRKERRIDLNENKKDKERTNSEPKDNEKEPQRKADVLYFEEREKQNGKYASDKKDFPPEMDTSLSNFEKIELKKQEDFKPPLSNNFMNVSADTSDTDDVIEGKPGKCGDLGDHGNEGYQLRFNEDQCYGSENDLKRELKTWIDNHFDGIGNKTKRSTQMYAERSQKGEFNDASIENSPFADIEDQLKDIDAHQIALKQRRDSGTVEETTSGITCLDDLIDNETQEAMAAGMDAFYMRISGCLESMNNINRLLPGDDAATVEINQIDPVSHVRVSHPSLRIIYDLN